ncbi:hypothetical protein JCM17846_13830 [Iodidimonas nitroreducens]|uniref:Uncharacterized protein n=1 Tax=Iodidimonas nitroreducens TaxID=1236968 RepID=A0A5A7N5X3_9PROT|nr:hypothetical protein JCM17846_13830 [Iodidimonas nitroreducens]
MFPWWHQSCRPSRSNDLSQCCEIDHSQGIPKNFLKYVHYNTLNDIIFVNIAEYTQYLGEK